MDTSSVTAPITDAERQYAVDALKAAQDNLHQALHGLSVGQVQHKPAPDRWSVDECLEHIILVEKGIFRSVQSVMKTPSDPARRAEIRISDVDVIRFVRSRTTGIASPEPFVPTGRFGDTTASLLAFDQQHGAVIDYAQTTADDLRTHYFQHLVFGTLDTYQALLLIASHTERHRKQIDEVKASPGFPA